MIRILISSFHQFIIGDREGRSAIVTFLGTISFSAGSYLASHYDRISACALSLAGLAFLVWRWRKSAKTHLCDKANCPFRHDPTNSA